MGGIRSRLASLLLLTATAAAAQDTVVVTNADGRGRAMRQGEIVELTGTELKLKNSAGRVETLPAGRIVEFRTDWRADHLRARELHGTGKLGEAITAYEEAKRSEPRAWAQRQIMAERSQCLAESGRFDLAGEEFLAIVASDPATGHLAAMPLAWRSFPPDAALESRAAGWLAAGSKSPAAQLLGASWLLSTSRRSEAVQRLEELSLKRGAEDDQRLAMLAELQLWRTKVVTAKALDVGRWMDAVERMPTAVQPGGWFVVGEAYGRLKQPEEAALAYLRVPLVHRAPSILRADALLAAGKQLESLDRKEQAAGLYREVLADYGDCHAAREAQSLLELLTKAD